MEPKLLLIQIITLIYKESLITNNNNKSNELIKLVMDSIKIPEHTIERDSGRETIQTLRNTILWILENIHQNEKISKEALLQRIKINTREESYLFDAFALSIEKDIIDEKILINECRVIRKSLNNFLNQIKLTAIIKGVYNKLLFSPENINWNDIVQNTILELETCKINVSGDDKKILSLINSVDVSDHDSIKNLFEEAKDSLSLDGMMSLGWQGINRMLGGVGVRRGENIVIGAQQHNFKSGFVMNMAKHLALYNKPKLFFGDNKKPLIVVISTENNLADQVLTWFYVNLKENEEKVECDINNVSDEEMANYVKEKLTINGFHFKFYQFNPSDFTYSDLFDLINDLESEDYEIHAIIFDYLNMINKKGCLTGPNGVEIRDLFRRVRNFTGPKKITFITPHQLSSESKNLTRQGVEDFVKEVVNKSYWDGCKSIDQEVDLEIIIHKVCVNGHYYLTVQRGKHRKVQITPESDLYCVLPFEPVGGILDDINSQDRTLKYAGGGAVGSGQEKPFWV